MILCTAGQVLAAILCAGHKCQTAVADVAVRRCLYLEKAADGKRQNIYTVKRTRQEDKRHI